MRRDSWGRREQIQTMNFIRLAIVQFYSAEFVCAADCLGRNEGEGEGNESELKRSIKNVNSPNWDVKWRITIGENRSGESLSTLLADCAREKAASRRFCEIQSSGTRQKPSRKANKTARRKLRKQAWIVQRLSSSLIADLCVGYYLASPWKSWRLISQ